MTFDLAFTLASMIVMPFWALMIFAPRWQITHRLMSSYLVVAVLPAAYAALLLPRIGEFLPFFTSMPTLESVQQLLGSPTGALIGWVHFLAFDLFVGRWIYLTSRELTISPWVTGPVLFLTLMMGPVGLLAFLIIRAMSRGNHK